MHQNDIRLMTEALNDLSELYRVTPPTTGAMKVWVNTLDSINPKFVHKVINDWAASHNKFPTPHDVRVPALALQSARMEELAEQERIENEQASKKPLARNASPQVRRALDRFFYQLNNTPKRPDRLWIDQLIAQSTREPLLTCQWQALKRAGEILPLSKERIARAVDAVNQFNRLGFVRSFSSILAEEMR